MATRDYTLGRGKILFKKSGAAGYLDLGNAPALSISVSVDKIEHLSSREGLSVKDLEVITKLGMAGSFTLDEPNAVNLAMFLMSTGATAANQSADGAPTIANVALGGAAALGSWFPLYKTANLTKSVDAAVAADTNTGTSIVTSGGTPGAGCTASRTYTIVVSASGTPDVFMWKRNDGTWTYGVNVTGAAQTLEDGITVTFDSTTTSLANDKFTFTVTVTPAGSSRVFSLDPASVATVTDGSNTLVSGVAGVGHYLIDYAAGMIFINPNQPGTNALDGSETLVFTTIDLLAADRVLTSGGTLTSLTGDLYFVGAPPQGRIVDVQGFCSLSPNGDWSLVGTDWMQIQFNIEFLKVDGVDGLVHLTDRGKAGTA